MTLLEIFIIAPFAIVLMAVVAFWFAIHIFAMNEFKHEKTPLFCVILLDWIVLSIYLAKNLYGV